MASNPSTHAKGTEDTMQSNTNNPSSLEVVHKVHCIHQKPCNICGRTHCSFIHCSKRAPTNPFIKRPPVEEVNAHSSSQSTKPIVSKQVGAQDSDSSKTLHRDHAQSSGSIKLFSKKRVNAQSSGSANTPRTHRDHPQGSASINLFGLRQVNAQSSDLTFVTPRNRDYAQSSGFFKVSGPKRVKAQSSNSTKLPIPEQANAQSSDFTNPPASTQGKAPKRDSTKLHIPEQVNAQSSGSVKPPTPEQVEAQSSDLIKTPHHKHSHHATAKEEDISCWSHVSVGRKGAVVVNVSTKDHSKLGHVNVYANIPRVDEPSVKVSMEDVKGLEGEEDGKGEKDGKEGEEGEWEVVRF